MGTNRNAAAAGPVTPTSDEAGSARNAPAPEKQDQQTEAYFAVDEASRKAVATMRARAALLGLVLRPMAGGAWCVVTESGAETAMPSLQAAEALVWGCEQVQAEIGALAARLVPSRELRA